MIRYYGILDLYKQEKEKNKEYYKIGYNHGCNDTSLFNKREFIRKDKIKAKIEDYNKMIKATYRDMTHLGDVRRDNCLEIISVLQELLEE